jgi:hypothetical protein
MKTISSICIAIGILSLAGCGGGGSSDGGGGPAFLVWSGSSGGSSVIDGTGHSFAFFADSGCLYNAQTQRENTAFCLSPGSNIVSYGAFRGQVANVLVSNGTCQAAIIDSLTGNFSDIELDAYGREVVLTTQLHPALCVQ